MNIYQQWGFTQSPFSTTSLPASEDGERLLIGREKELESLIRRIFNPPKLATVEGLNGVGKTSLVNVAAYKAYQRSIDSKDSTLFIPCNQTFQLSSTQSADDFVQEVLFAVAQTLILYEDGFSSRGISLDLSSLNDWLNMPHLKAYQGALGPVSLGQSAETNTSIGFERSGLNRQVLRCLSQAFPIPEAGGVICVIDNLELLESSKNARNIVEQLRDKLFTLIGLRWVLCGALGIVLGVASSPRLEGLLHSPVEVGSISDDIVKEVLASRTQVFSKEKDTEYLPITENDFEDLYDILNKNLRSLLGKADDYCQWVADRKAPVSTEDKRIAFKEWLNDQAERAYQAFKSKLKPRAIRVFEDAIKKGGVFAPSDYEEFEFNSIEAIRPHVKDLEDAGILVSTQDEGDKRRKTIQITAKGWLVFYAMSQQSTD